MGNMMIQPMTYFDLQGVPMFSGAYLITEVSHSVKPNNTSTTFKGVRQPRTIVPLVTSASIAMNLTFDETSTGTGTGTGASLKSIGRGADWKSQVNTTSSLYNKINKNSTEDDIMNVIRDYVEGGYYHPVTWYINGEGTKNGFDVYDRSGETMFGEDRAAGQTEGTASGAAFWAYIDTQSGYGDYGTLPPTKPTANATSDNNYSRKHRTNEWNKSFLQELSTRTKVWKWNYKPTNDKKLEDLSNKMAKTQVNNLFNQNFKNQDTLVTRIKNDGRLLFAWYRARYNGSGYFSTFAKNLIKVFKENPSITDDDLLIADLNYRSDGALIDMKLGPNAKELIRKDVLVIAEIVGFKSPNKSVVAK
jgi:hypothetical protein